MLVDMRPLINQSSHPRFIERLVLSLGVASSLAMGLAALQIQLRPDWMGEFVLDEASRKLSAGVKDEWNRLLREPQLWLDFGPAALHWEFDSRPGQSAEEPAPGPTANESFAAFDALFSQALHREISLTDPAGALSATLAALEQPCDAARRARARLRALQLAQTTGESAEALNQWKALRSEATGLEQEGGVSCLMLGALAIAPALDAAERVSVRADLVRRWGSASLALPGEVQSVRDATGRLGLELPLEVLVLADELQGLVDGPKDDRLASGLERQRTLGLERMLGELPREPVDGRLGLQLWKQDTFAFHAAPGGKRFIGNFIGEEQLRVALGERLQSLAFLPEGFSVDLGGPGQAAGQVISERNSLWGEQLGFRLRHEDPEGFMLGEERRLGLLQAGLLASAAFTLLAGIVSFQALRRQRVFHGLKARFVASVSHELRTPVTGILLASENLVEGRANTPERLDRYHGLIRKEALRLRGLVDDVLDFSRIERGASINLHFESVPLESLIAGLVAECKRRVEDAGLAFESEVRLSVESLRCDGEALRRALTNLVSNALQHSGAKTVTLKVRTDEVLVIRVDDDGKGIEPALREVIFEPFRQAGSGDDATGASTQGTGLGLTIVREIVEGHGGNVCCLALDGVQGTRFELTLPLGAAPGV